MDNRREQPPKGNSPEPNFSPQTEAETRGRIYRETARKTLMGLGYSKTTQKVEAIVKKNNPGLKMIFGEAGFDTSQYDARGIDAEIERISCIPDKTKARQLVITAIFGIPASSNPTEDIVAEFPVATSSSLMTTDINPVGQSQSKPKPDLKGTQELLKSMLQETGFLANNTAEEDFKKIRAELNKGVTLAHPNYSGLSISIRPTEPGTYGIKIVNRKI